MIASEQTGLIDHAYLGKTFMKNKQTSSFISIYQVMMLLRVKFSDPENGIEFSVFKSMQKGTAV